MKELKIKLWYPALAIFMFMPLSIFWQSTYANFFYAFNIFNIFYFFIRFNKVYIKLINEKIVKLYIVFNIVITISCLINNLLTPGMIYSILSNYTVIMIILIYKDTIVERLSLLFRIIIVINIITYFLRGMLFTKIIAISLLGNKNDFAVLLIPMITILMIDWIQRNNKYSYYFAFIGSLSLFIGFSGTGVICGLFSLFILIFYRYIAINKRFLVCVIIMLFIILLSNNTSYFASFTSILNKDITFTNRTYIWAQTISKIISSPLIGYGRGATTAIVNLYGNTMHTFTETHNLILEVFFEGGILSGVTFIYIYASIIKIINRKTPIGKISMLFIICLFIAGLMESFANNLMLWIFTTIIYLVNKKD